MVSTWQKLPKLQNKHSPSSAGSTIVANVAIATGPAGSFVLNLFFTVCRGGY